MVVVIAPENDIFKEIETLHQLFKEGLQYYHLRKPNKNYSEHESYLNKIDKKYHNRIITHYYHELLSNFNLKGIHFQEAKRKEVLKHITTKNTKADFLQNYAQIIGIDYERLNTKTISSSFHETFDLEHCPNYFDYHLLSPIFSSISKKGYEGRGFDVNHINKTVVGMGGVTSKNLDEFKKLGFKGLGVLGGIWNSKNPVSNFKLMHMSFRI